MTQSTKKQRTLVGTVVSNKMQKTVVVAITRWKKSAKYQKYYKTEKRYKAHDEKNAYKVGDTVTIGESRPLSREKRWTVVGYASAIKEKEQGEPSLTS